MIFLNLLGSAPPKIAPKTSKSSSSLTLSQPLTLRKEETAADLGSALRALSENRLKAEQVLQSEMNEEAKSTKSAKISLRESEEEDIEKKELIKEISRQKQKSDIAEKLRERALLRDAIVSKVKAAEKEKIRGAHKSLAEESNTKVLAR
jgi:hypothetical protein